MWFISGEDVTIEVEYMVEGQYVLPSIASYSLRNHVGVEIDSGSLPASSTQDSLTLASSLNSVGSLWENRHLIVTFVFEGRTYQKTIVYQISDFIPLTMGAEHVRSALGLDEKELLDREVDLFQVYFRLSETLGSSFTSAFTVIGNQNWAANRLVVLRAAIDIARSLPMRTRISIRTEDTSEKRTEKIDFDSIVGALEDEFVSLRDVALGVSATLPTLFALSTPTDVITG